MALEFYEPKSFRLFQRARFLLFTLSISFVLIKAVICDIQYIQTFSVVKRFSKAIFTIVTFFILDFHLKRKRRDAFQTQRTYSLSL